MSTESTILYVDELCCADDERRIKNIFENVPGIKNLNIDFVSRKVIIQHTCSQQSIIESIRQIGFSPRLHHERQERGSLWKQHHQLLFTILSGIFLTTGLATEYFNSQQTSSEILFVLSVICGGWRIGIKSLKALRHFSFDMNVLMIAAAIAAMGIGKFGEGAAVIFLFMVSNVLEHYSLERSRSRIRSLMNVNPTNVGVLRDGVEVSLSVERVSPGDHIIIRPGERISLDGSVISGDSTVDQSPITGESMPVRKINGNEIFAGSLNQHGTLEIVVNHGYRDTTLARIVRTIEESQTERASIQTIGERFARYYTPAVLLLSILVVSVPTIFFHQSFQEWFYRSLVLLVIACPCALVISIPVSILSGITNAARHGILIKGGRALEALGKLRVIAFDKTGTLTRGTPCVTDVIPMNSLPPKRILQLTAALETKSEHHLAKAVIKRASEERILLNDISVEHFSSLPGLGVSATIDGVSYIAGNHTFIEERNLCSPATERILQKLEGEGKTAIILCDEEAAVGIIAITDEVRAESNSVVHALRGNGIEKIVMLTGDNERTAHAIAESSGIDEYYAELLPHQKAERIRSLQNHYGNVAMVGDGINDAPALAASTVGIAMGNSGTDIALETADVVLMSDDISKLPHVVHLSKSTLSIIRQNIIFALLVKLLFITLGIFGTTSLWLAVLADDGATLFVILNSLRALRVNER